jgi:hypothetical protein
MHDAVEGTSLLICAGKDALEMGAVGELALDKLNALRQKLAAAVAEVVENDRLMTSIDEEARDGTSDISCTTCYKKLHKKTFPSLEQLWFSLSLLNQTGGLRDGLYPPKRPHQKRQGVGPAL